ncbi:hypothetical protein CGZ95_02240 [Enemella evansiae]|uniref:LpqB family beta-propeller domain-containing protein n=1 Tax=Enemella evansiae TaxID=2016499 RepID=UPI000B9601DA|nr:LpqB family beta-propeller domain-containing protein [Enemella evansiae]OYO05132.1 hypothetical protein CGZ95_02240 [Enemella evansiae]
MTGRPPAAPLAMLVLLLSLLLGGCVSLPVKGPVQAGAGPSQAPDVSVEVAPEAPQPGASPRTIAEGFLQAMASYQQGYPVARQYLASSVRDSWRPEDGVTVYADGYGVTSGPESALLQAPQVGQVGPDGAFSHGEGTLRHDFGMVRDVDGEWRISHPPQGLLISQYLFGKFYQQASVYFFDPSWRTLVPDPVFLPRGNQTPTALLQALLRGPTDWLKPAVVTAVPTQAKLNVQAAYVDSLGVVEISLNDAVQGLAEDQRSRVAAQIAWTLGQVSGVSGVRLTVNGAPWSVREQNQAGVIPISAYGSLDPVPPASQSTLLGATADGVVTISDGSSPATLAPVAGPLGRTGGVSGMAATPTGDRIAVITGNGTDLLVGQSNDTPLEPLVSNGQGLLRPQYLPGRELELWTILDGPLGQQAWVRIGSAVQRVALSGFDGTRVTAFRVSPDGTRMAVIRVRDGISELGLVRVNRAQPELTIDGWRTVPLSDEANPGPRRLLDVAWQDASTLLVLGSEDDKKPVKPYRVDQSAAELTEIGQPDNWQATSLAVAPRRVGTRAVVVGRTGAWRYEDDYRWPLLTREVLVAAYTG